MLLLSLDRKDITPLYKQVYNQIVSLIDKGVIKPGNRLPSSRVMAGNHDVSRITITRAYEELISHGYAESNPGGFTTIRFRKKETIYTGKNSNCSIDWNRVNTDCYIDKESGWEDQLLKPDLKRADTDFIDMSWFDIDERIFPLKEFKRSITSAFDKYGKELFIQL